MSYVQRQEHKKKKNPYLPIIGLIIAICLGAIAYLVSPFIMDILEEQSTTFAERLNEPDGERNIRIALTIVLWFLTLALFTGIVAMMTPKNLILDEGKNVRPRDMNPKSQAKYEKRMAEKRKAEIKAVKRLKGKKEKEQRKQGKL